MFGEPNCYPAEENGFLVEHIILIRQSLRQLTGRDLVCQGLSDEESARAVFEAPFVVLSHDGATDPVLNYANLAGLRLFELSWDELVATPSRFTAEEIQRAERARLLERVAADGFIDDYAGIRISKAGRRFRIQSATVWNLSDANGNYRGQAASFEKWLML